jgi:hypothetical protein
VGFHRKDFQQHATHFIRAIWPRAIINRSGWFYSIRTTAWVISHKIEKINSLWNHSLMKSDPDEHETITPSGGLTRRMDERLALVNRLLDEILTLEIPLARDVAMTMRWCPTGPLMMKVREVDSDDIVDDSADDEAEPVVTLTGGFWLGTTEVTQAQWQAVMGTTLSESANGQFPVKRVTEAEVNAFIEKINRSGILRDGWRMVLLPEDQREYTCRAGETEAFGSESLDQTEWHEENRGSRTQPARIPHPTEGGHQVTNSTGSPSAISHQFRGGSWADRPSAFRVARFMKLPVSRSKSLDFRAALIPSK